MKQSSGILKGLSLLIILFFCDFTHSAPQSQRNTADYSVTHLDIRDAILSLVSVLRDQMDKLERHEVRERQLGEQLTRTLSAIEKRGRGEEKNIENIASYLTRIEEKSKFLQATLEKQSEDRKLEHESRSVELGAMRQMLSNGSGIGSRQLEKKIDAIHEKINQMKTVGETNSEKFDSLMELWKQSSASPADSGSELTETLLHELGDIKEALARTVEQTSKISSSSDGGNEWQMDMVESVESQRKQLAVLEEEVGKVLGLLGDMTVSASGLSTVLSKLDSDSTEGFKNLGNQINGLGGGSSDGGQVEQIVRETEEVIKSLSSKLEAGFGQMSNELKGLSNVENVLLDTADSVLETRRRLEYGVQQIMGELNSKVAHYSSNLNNSLQLRFDNLANSVLGNQSMALTNLTSRMEGEISQVWRQIGLIYHQMSKSANLLDEIHSQTSKYVNNSLDTMTSMDGKVGQITNRMGEVDDNLNYLLGRMGLVVQEFNMIKGGLGDALQSLKESFVEISEIEEKANSGGQSENSILEIENKAEDNNEVE